MVEAQHGRCIGCAASQQYAKPQQTVSDRPLCVDHNHVTNKVRGLLCRACNLIVGNAGDDPVVLRNLADYLEAH
jgi:hypothetical protein